MRPKSTSGNDTAHRATSLSARELALWLPPATSADSNLIPELGALVSRSRDLVHNHGVASGAFQTLTDTDRLNFIIAIKTSL